MTEKIRPFQFPLQDSQFLRTGKPPAHKIVFQFPLQDSIDRLMVKPYSILDFFQFPLQDSDIPDDLATPFIKQLSISFAGFSSI